MNESGWTGFFGATAGGCCLFFAGGLVQKAATRLTQECAKTLESKIIITDCQWFAIFWSR